MDRAQLLNDSLLPDGRYPRKLEIKQTTLPDAGLGLFTNASIPAGEEVLSKTLMMSAVNNKHLDTICDYCFTWNGDWMTTDGRRKTVEKLPPEWKRCSACKIVYYCSKTCQSKAWKAYHKAECGKYARVQEHMAIFRLCLRLVLNHQTDNSKVLKEWPAIMALQSKPVTDTNVNLNDIPEITALARIGMINDENLMKEIFSRLVVNYIAVWPSYEHETLGAALDPLISMMNHSCEPNVAIVSEGNRVYIRSVRSIAAGEEITYPYIDPTSPKWVRQSQLQSRLFFTCACSKCTSESDANETTISGYSKKTLDKLSEINSTMDYLKPDEAEQQLTSLLGDAKQWPSADTYPMAGIYVQLADSFSYKREFHKEIRYMLHVCCVADPASYANQRQHPLRIRNLVQLALAITAPRKFPSITIATDPAPLGDNQLGLAYVYSIMKAAEHVDASHGPGSSFSRMVKRLIAMEAQMVAPNWQEAYVIMKTDIAQAEMRNEFERLLDWVGIPVTPTTLLEF